MAGAALAAKYNGGKHSPDRVAKIRQSLTGRRLSQEHRMAIGAASKAAWAARRARKAKDYAHEPSLFNPHVEGD